jgi:hypothetical protein
LSSSRHDRCISYSSSIESGSDAVISEASIRTALTRVEPDIAIERIQSTNDVVRSVLSPSRLLATLMSVLGTAGLVLLALGIFGAVATALRAAWPEIAVRQAIGASPFAAARAPIRTLSRSILCGVVLGLAVTPLVLSGAAASGLGTSGTPALPMLLAGLAVLVAAIGATAPSLVRAARSSPAELLRAR